LLCTVFDRDSLSVHAVDDLAILMKLAPSPELKQVLGLDLEEAALDRGGASQPPQQAGQSQPPRLRP
jgi:hypothetical protein